MEGLQIKVIAIGALGEIEFLDENDLVVMGYKWVDENIELKLTRSEHTGEMTKIAESIRELAMKIGE